MYDMDSILAVVENPTRRKILQAVVREPHYPLQLSKELGISQQAEAPEVKDSFSFSKDMNKKFVTVNALLKVEGIEQSADDKLVLTAEQFQVIEDALAESQGKIENLGKMEAALAASKASQKTAEDNLQAASDTLDTLSDDIKQIEGISNKVAKIKEMFDKIPAVQAPTPAPAVKDEFADIRKDPVNFYDEE